MHKILSILNCCIVVIATMRDDNGAETLRITTYTGKQGGGMVEVMEDLTTNEASATYSSNGIRLIEWSSNPDSPNNSNLFGDAKDVSSIHDLCATTFFQIK